VGYLSKTVGESSLIEAADIFHDPGKGIPQATGERGAIRPDRGRSPQSPGILVLLSELLVRNADVHGAV
jgi:hypothetical protein